MNLPNINIDEIVETSPVTKKKNVIMDSQILTALMTCPRLSDFRFNYRFQSINGKPTFLECGSIVHMYQEYFNRAVIGGIDRPKAHNYGMIAAELYIQGCPNCTGFVEYKCDCNTNSITNEGIELISDVNCNKCNGTGNISKPLCGHKPNEFPGVRNTPKETDGTKIGWSWVLDTCEQYYKRWINDHWVPIEVEIVKGTILYEDDFIRVLWKAKLDLTVDTNQGIYPVDHKTGKQFRKILSMDNQFMGQCLTMRTQNVMINRIGFQTTLKPEEKFIRIPMGYSTERLLEWQSEVLPYYAMELIKFSEMEHFPPNFTSCQTRYGYCGYLKICESNPSHREYEIRQNFVIGPEWNPTNDDLDNEGEEQ